MKTLRLTLFTSLLACAVQAQSTKIAPATGVRLQSVIKRDGVAATNAPTQASTNAVKTSAHLDEFIGTLLSVDQQKQTVSIALGPPFVASQVEARSFSLAPETKFFKEDAVATLGDGVIGEAVRYRIRINHKDNTRALTVLRFLPNFKDKRNK